MVAPCALDRSAGVGFGVELARPDHGKLMDDLRREIVEFDRRRDATEVGLGQHGRCGGFARSERRVEAKLAGEV